MKENEDYPAVDTEEAFDSFFLEVTGVRRIHARGFINNFTEEHTHLACLMESWLSRASNQVASRDFSEDDLRAIYNGDSEALTHKHMRAADFHYPVVIMMLKGVLEGSECAATFPLKGLGEVALAIKYLEGVLGN